jgi:hypothetical protein
MPQNAPSGSWCAGMQHLAIYSVPLYRDISEARQFACSNPAEDIRICQGEKHSQHAFLRRGSKAVGPMSQICGM